MMTNNVDKEIGKKRSPEAIRLRKRAVLDSAADEFSRNGYSGADMDRIAEAARVGKGTIYRYYSSKGKLFEAVADDAIGELRDFVFSRVGKAECEGPINQLKAAGRAFLEFFDERGALLEIFLRGGSQFRERIQMRYLEIYEENIHLVQNLLDEGIEQGFLRRLDTRRLADSIGDMMVGLVYMWGARKEKTPLSKKWDFVEEVIMRGILAV